MDVKILENKREFACISYLFGDIMIDAGVDPGIPVKKLILTHCHFDHVIYANLIKKKYGAKIYASEKCALNLKKPKVSNPLLEWEFEIVEVDEIIKDGDKIGDLAVLETPGHTDGSICLYHPEKKILFSGDTLFHEGFGRTDLPTGNEKKLICSLERIKKINPLHVFSGH